jgi:hypothetical protein
MCYNGREHAYGTESEMDDQLRGWRVTHGHLWLTIRRA